MYVFAFDDVCYEYLKRKKPDFVTVIALAEFENDELLRIKAQRSKGEYCWTCTPATIHYAISKFNLDHCIYVDSDLFFYSDPEILVREMGEKNVLITDHRYTKYYDQSALCGRYCVQFMYFSNESTSLQLLEWWRDECISWCFARFEDGKFGDQKYLDDWHNLENVHVLQHEGGGVAPWNVQQYKIVKIADSISVVKKSDNCSSDLVFFHFHDLKLFSNGNVALSGHHYKLGSDVKKYLYAGYVEELTVNAEKLKKEGIDVYSTVQGGRLALIRNSVVYLRIKGFIRWLLTGKIFQPLQVSNLYDIRSFINSFLGR
ncbi:MAG: glycosyl transferase [Imperialibacter sp.]|uniref:glycosyl transferase n=1 Tax=Imperialibacter sp. TaxID=2038411 RepID=UPI0032ED6942